MGESWLFAPEEGVPGAVAVCFAVVRTVEVGMAPANGVLPWDSSSEAAAAVACRVGYRPLSANLARLILKYA